MNFQTMKSNWSIINVFKLYEAQLNNELVIGGGVPSTDHASTKGQAFISAV